MTELSPRVDDAPGLTWRKLVNGWQARWQCRTDIARTGFKPSSWRLWSGTWPTEFEAKMIAEYCQRLQYEMLEWGRGSVVPIAVYDGTLKGLAARYQVDECSTYRKLRFKSRTNYDGLIRRLLRDCVLVESLPAGFVGPPRAGSIPLSAIKARTLLQWHATWTADGKVTMAHTLVAMLRILSNFGATMIEDPECERLCGVLHRMRFPQGKARSQIITAEQATAVRLMAHKMGYPSIALAQAFQFEIMLRQKDVIGEWVPQNEPGLSEVTDGQDKWMMGLRWSEIDRNLILRHVTSKRQKEIEVDLRNAPMVMEELPSVGGELPTSGPIIIDEKTGLPYRNYNFRARWREIATKAGVPKEVFNMDSRAGAISEATNAGADLEHVRHAATHSDIAMTQRYSRASTEKVAGVMQLRASRRNKPGT